MASALSHVSHCMGWLRMQVLASASGCAGGTRSYRLLDRALLPRCGDRPRDRCRPAHTGGMRSVLGSRTQAWGPKHGPGVLWLAGLVGGFLNSPVLLCTSAV